MVTDHMAGCQDPPDRVRVALGGRARHIERRRRSMVVEQLEDALQPATHAVPRLGERRKPAGIVRRRREPDRLGIDVEGERELRAGGFHRQ